MKNFIYVAVAITLAISLGTMAQAAEKNWKIDSLGFDYQEGSDVLLSESLQGDHCTNLVKRFSLRIESDSIVPYYLNDSWESQRETRPWARYWLQGSGIQCNNKKAFVQ
jgi:hypothetical protein